MDSEEYCILLGCENYFQAYPSEDLGECILDKKGQEGPRRIINSASICNHPLEKRIAQEGKWPFPGCQFDM